MRRIHELFEEQVVAAPERTAVISGDRHIEYSRLAAMAAGVARELRQRGVGRGDLVGVCLDRDEWLVAALLGVLQAGAAYVPVDPAYPAERQRFIVEDARLDHIVTSNAVVARIPGVSGSRLLVDDVRPDDAGVWVAGDPGDAAYVIYTSGSTGTPKGVVIEHRQSLNLLRWFVSAYSPEDMAGCLAAASVCFDVSVREIFGPLISGGTVILADGLLSLPALPARDRVVMIGGPPSGLAALLHQPLPARVRTVISGGEALTRALVEKLFANPGVRRVRNHYGPTECTTACLAADLTPGELGPPVLGEPIDGVELHVLDPGGRAVPDGEVGELWVAGNAVGRGYLHRPELTERRFVADSGVAGGRRYGTGDQVRRVDGIFHFVGRNDDQVKIRGFRVELGEVEHALAAHPAVAVAVATAPVDQRGERSLHAHVQLDGAATEPQLRAYLRERLPEYLVPSRIGVVERIPLAPNNKVDRAGLPLLGPPHSDAQPLGDGTEERIARIVAEVLGVPGVGADDRFTDLGGHSLAAARVVARVGEEFGVVVPLAQFLADPTVTGLAASVASAVTGHGPVHHEGRREFPLTDVQREFWVLRQIEPESTVTTAALRLRVTGLSDAGPLRAALDGLVERHEVLRTVFVERPDGPVAVVHPATAVPVSEVDVRDDPGQVDELVSAATAHTFDLAYDVPLIRATVIWTKESVADLVLTIDHCAFDGYSIGPLMNELNAALAGGTPDAPPVQVGDIAVYEQNLFAGSALEDFWRDELAGVTPPYHLTTRTRHGRPASPSERLVQALDPQLATGVERLAETCGVTPFTVYLSALAVVLRAMTGESETLIGVVSALRDRPGTDRVIGPLVGVLPIRIAMAGEATFRSLTADVAAATVRALAHQDLPAGEIARCAPVDRPAGESLTPVVISMQPAAVPVVLEHKDIRLELLGELGSGQTSHDLTLYLNSTAAGPELQIEYDTALFDRRDAESIARCLVQVLNAVTTEPDQPVPEIDLMRPAELQALLAAGCGPLLPGGELTNVVDAVLARAELTPDAVALADVDGELTYAELAEHSARLASALAGAEVVGVCLPRDRFLPAALLGVWRSGAGFVAMEPELPRDRLEWIAQDAGVDIVLSGGSALPAAQAIRGVRVVDQHDLGAHSGLPNDPGELAYVCYTSGSTGKPKGVEVTHANVAALATGLCSWPGVGPDDVVLALTPLSFDASVSDMWPVLTAGGRCVVVDRDTAIDGIALAERIAATGATLLQATPTTLRMVLAGGWQGSAGLRLWSGGEPLDAGIARDLVGRVAELWNLYGPTETTDTSTAYRILPGATSVPIGRPVAGEWVYVMDSRGRPVPPGAVGELWIGGTGVARGYRGRPELTGQSFVPDPLRPGGRCYRTGDRVRQRGDGELEFLGRRDHQVKIRGYRVELGEVEAAVRELPEVRDAVVTTRTDGGDAHLVGYLACSSTVDTAGLAARLREKLPEHLIPRRWVKIPRLPTLPTGKVDRAALPEPDRLAAGAAPSTVIEKLVAGVWQDVLNIAEPGLDADFFAMGGHSFAATRVVGRLRDALGCRVAVRVLFDHPMLGDFAVRLEELALAEIGDAMGPEGAA